MTNNEELLKAFIKTHNISKTKLTIYTGDDSVVYSWLGKRPLDIRITDTRVTVELKHPLDGTNTVLPITDFHSILNMIKAAA